MSPKSITHASTDFATTAMLYSLDLVTSVKLYPRTALALLTALNLFNYIDRSVLFAVQELIKKEFHRSAAMKFLLDQFLHRKQHRTVDVVEKVQRRQQSQRGAWIEFYRGHEIERI